MHWYVCYKSYFVLGKHHYSFYNLILEFHFQNIYKEPQKMGMTWQEHGL